MIRRPPRSTLFPTRRSSDLVLGFGGIGSEIARLCKAFDMHVGDRKSTRLNSSHLVISYAVFCLKKKKLVSMRSAASAPLETQSSPPPHCGSYAQRSLDAHRS